VQLEAQQVIVMVQKQVLCVADVEAVLKNDKAVLNLSALSNLVTVSPRFLFDLPTCLC